MPRSASKGMQKKKNWQVVVNEGNFVAEDGQKFPTKGLWEQQIRRASVATGVTVNEGALPVAREEGSREQEAEEDFLLSTRQTRELNIEESHEQETDDDSLSNTSTIDYDFEYTDEKNSSTSDDEDGSTDEELIKRMPELEHQWKAILFQTRNKWPDKDAWVATWKEVYELRRWTWITVYAYFQKGRGYGGYGVILRNAVAKPIIASAKFSKRW